MYRGSVAVYTTHSDEIEQYEEANIQQTASNAKDENTTTR